MAYVGADIEERVTGFESAAQNLADLGGPITLEIEHSLNKVGGIHNNANSIRRAHRGSNWFRNYRLIDQRSHTSEALASRAPPRHRNTSIMRSLLFGGSHRPFRRNPFYSGVYVSEAFLSSRNGVCHCKLEIGAQIRGI